MVKSSYSYSRELSLLLHFVLSQTTSSESNLNIREELCQMSPVPLTCVNPFKFIPIIKESFITSV